MPHDVTDPCAEPPYGDPVDAAELLDKCRDRLKLNAVRVSGKKIPLVPKGHVVCRDFESKDESLFYDQEKPPINRLAIQFSKQSPQGMLGVDSDVDIGTLPEELRQEFRWVRERSPGVWGGKFLMHVTDWSQAEADAYARRYTAQRTGVELFGTGQNLIVAGNYSWKDGSKAKPWVHAMSGGHGKNDVAEVKSDWVKKMFPLEAEKIEGVASGAPGAADVSGIIGGGGRHHWLRGFLLRHMAGLGEDRLRNILESPDKAFEVLLEEYNELWSDKIGGWQSEFRDNAQRMSEVRKLMVWAAQKVREDGKSAVEKEYFKTTVNLTAAEFKVVVTSDIRELFLWRDNHWEGNGADYDPESRIIDWLGEAVEDLTLKQRKYVIELIKNTKKFKVSRKKFDALDGVAFRNGWLDLETLELTDNKSDNMNRSYIDSDIVVPGVDDRPPSGEDWTLEYADKWMGDSVSWRVMRDAMKDPRTYQVRWETGLHMLLEAMCLCVKMVEGVPKIVFNTGKGSNSKSTIWKFFIGKFGDFVSSVTPQMLSDDKFAPSRTEGMLVNYYDDVSKDPVKSMDTLKIISSGGTMDVQRKGKDLHKARMTSQPVFSLNEMVAIGDATIGMGRRVCVIEWRRIFSDSAKDTTLPAQMRKDTAGAARLFGMLVHMRRRMAERGKTLRSGAVDLTETQIAEAGGSREIAEATAMVDKIDRMSHPLKALIEDRVTEDLEWCIPRSAFYKKVYVPYCRDRGVKPWSPKGVASALKDEFESEAVYVRELRHSVRVWVGMLVTDTEGQRIPECVRNPKADEDHTVQSTLGIQAAAPAGPPPAASATEPAAKPAVADTATKPAAADKAESTAKPAGPGDGGPCDKCKECGHENQCVCVIHDCECCTYRDKGGMPRHMQE